MCEFHLTKLIIWLSFCSLVWIFAAFILRISLSQTTTPAIPPYSQPLLQIDTFRMFLHIQQFTLYFHEQIVGFSLMLLWLWQRKRDGQVEWYIEQQHITLMEVVYHGCIVSPLYSLQHSSIVVQRSHWHLLPFCCSLIHCLFSSCVTIHVSY